MKHLRLAGLIVAAAFLCAQLTGVTRAELLQRLHVLDFKMTSDTQHPRVGVPFHVMVTIHVRERVADLQDVYLPTLLGFENRGDRRFLTRLPGGGSIYQETLTLIPRKPGTTAIGSAYLDAVDLRDSKTKRFVSNNLILNVTGGTLPASRATARTTLLAALLLLAAALLAAVLLLRRRRRVTAHPQPAPPAADTAPPAEPIRLDEALQDLRIRRDRSSVLRVREALWSIAGANRGETLADVLQREPACRDGLRPMLVSIEHAAFTHEGSLQQAIDDALAQGEHALAR